jgi:alpha-amylase
MAWKHGLRWLGVVAGLIVLLVAGNHGFAVADSLSKNNLVYHIFVRSWADTPSDDDEIGDLRGLREKLDYLNDGDPETDDDLEVGILWLMPIFPSPSYHGYDVTDYEAVNPDYGTMQDLKDLIESAHHRGMRIILDIPFNHTSNQHPWFRDAVNNPASPFHKFYHFTDINQPAPPGPWHVATGSSGQKVRYLGLFSPSMPDLNFNIPEVREAIKEIARFWLEQGIDGFRLDAAKHIFGDTFGLIPEPDILHNNAWWREFSDAIYRIRKDAVLVGEVLGDQEALRRHAYGLDALLDEPFMNATRSRIAFPASGFLTNWRDFVNRCRDVNRNAHVGPGLMPRDEPFQPFIFLSSHDANPRLASHLEEMKYHGMRPSVDEAYRVGMYVLTSLGRYPILYYGDEVMQRGFKWNGNPANGNPSGDGSGLFDETLREPFPWHKSGDDPAKGDHDMQTDWSDLIPRFDRPNDGVSVEEQDDVGGLLHLIRGLTNLRTEHPGYANGELGDILTDSTDWLVFEKVSAQDRYLVLINPTEMGKNYRFHDGWFPRYRSAQLIFWSDGQRKEWKDESKNNKCIEAAVFVPPYGMVVIRQKQN